MFANNEQTVLAQAIEAFHKETGLRFDIAKTEFNQGANKLRIDVLLQIEGYKQPQYAAEVKKWAQQANFGALVEQLKRLPEPRLLVADYINPNMAERLREVDIQFIDAAGNAYIDAEPLHIHIKGNRQQNTLANQKELLGKAFTATGLKIIYAFLCKPDLVNAPYRDIAQKADVALGTVGQVMRDLKAIGYLIDRGTKQTRRLNNYFDLFDQWVELYPALLRPKQLLGVFNKHDVTDPEQVDIKQYDAYWGGEIAGAKYTGYLRGEMDIVYIPEQKAGNLIHALKLFKGDDDKAYDIMKLYKPFWQQPEHYNGYVQPVLACADLIATGDTRNIETAQIIKDEHIKPLGQT